MSAKIDGKIALVTGSNRGIGLALVEALLDRGAKKVYATARVVESLRPLLEKYGDRVVPLALDVTDKAGTIGWTGLAAADSYDLGGGYLSDLRASRDTSAAECLVSGETDTLWLDTRDIPPPEDGYYYLARGRNACAPGSFGTSSNGSPRAENACP